MRILSKIHTAARLLALGNFPVFRRLLRANLCAWRIRNAGNQPFKYRLRGMPFVCFPGQPDSEYTYTLGEVDTYEFGVLRQWLLPGDAMIDVGASIGLYTIAASSVVGDSGSLLAIDASATMTSLVVETSRRLGRDRVAIETTAVGDVEKEVSFYSALPGMATCEQSLRPAKELTAYYREGRVRMSTLAEIVRKHPDVSQPALVKIDIEGAESMALQGTPGHWFSNSGPCWIIELNPRALARCETCCAAITGRFAPGDFDLWLAPHFSMDRDIRNPPPRALGSSELFADAQFYNLVAVPLGPQFASRRMRLQKVFRSSVAKTSDAA